MPILRSLLHWLTPRNRVRTSTPLTEGDAAPKSKSWAASTPRISRSEGLIAWELDLPERHGAKLSFSRHETCISIMIFAATPDGSEPEAARPLRRTLPLLPEMQSQPRTSWLEGKLRIEFDAPVTESTSRCQDEWQDFKWLHVNAPLQGPNEPLVDIERNPEKNVTCERVRASNPHVLALSSAQSRTVKTSAR